MTREAERGIFWHLMGIEQHGSADLRKDAGGLVRAASSKPAGSELSARASRTGFGLLYSAGFDCFIIRAQF